MMTSVEFFEKSKSEVRTYSTNWNVPCKLLRALGTHHFLTVLQDGHDEEGNDQVVVRGSAACTLGRSLKRRKAAGLFPPPGEEGCFEDASKQLRKGKAVRSELFISLHFHCRAGFLKAVPQNDSNALAEMQSQVLRAGEGKNLIDMRRGPDSLLEAYNPLYPQE